MITASFAHYLELRPRFEVTRELAVRALDWAEPLARTALGAYSQRDKLGLGEQIPILPMLTTPEDNGGWGELMPVWFKPYERPLPIFILNNWAMTALALQHWLGEIGPAFNVENLLKVFGGSSILIPFMPAVERGGQFLRHGALTVLLGFLWLPANDREAFLPALAAGGRRFADVYRLDEEEYLADVVGRLEAEAFLIAEGSRIGGEDRIRTFLANQDRFDAYAALFGGLCFSVAALYDWYGPDWEKWTFQGINVHYRYAAFGLEPWARWLGIEYLEPI